MEKMIALRLEPEQILKLEALVKITGWNQSEVIRQLIDNASVQPPTVRAEIAAKKAVPLVAMAA